MTIGRRETRTRVPVVLPLVQITVSEGQLDVLVDREPYDVDDTWTSLGRAGVPRVVDQIATRLGCPVRVEVTDSDGAVLVDIVIPRAESTDEAEAEPPQSERSLTGLVADGFVPGEQVAVAVVVAHHCADVDGTTRFRCPPALLTYRRTTVVLLGRTSGTVAVISDGAE